MTPYPDEALRHEYGGVITLTDVTGDGPAVARADIVVHYVPRFGGVVFLGTSHCTANTKSCNNVIVQSDVPQKFLGDSTPEEFYTLVQHELGHALGLAHTNPLEAIDVMGYSWLRTGQGVELSDCDLAAVGAVFEWALEGSEPHPPTATEVVCN